MSELKVYDPEGERRILDPEDERRELIQKAVSKLPWTKTSGNLASLNLQTLLPDPPELLPAAPDLSPEQRALRNEEEKLRSDQESVKKEQKKLLKRCEEEKLISLHSIRTEAGPAYAIIVTDPQLLAAVNNADYWKDGPATLASTRSKAETTTLKIG